MFESIMNSKSFKMDVGFLGEILGNPDPLLTSPGDIDSQMQ
jgi:hypothetical protein